MAVIIPMPAGRRRHLITVQSQTQTVDASGQPISSWSTYCQRYANVEATGGSERFRGRQISAQMTHVAELLADSVTRLIKPDMRMLWSGRVIHLKVVRPLDGENAMIELQGAEVVV